MSKGKIKLDKETTVLLSEQEKIKKLTEHAGWGIVRAKMLAECAALLNLNGLDVTNGDNLLKEIMGRQLAANLIVKVQGTADQFEANSGLTEEINNGYILRNDMVIEYPKK